MALVDYARVSSVGQSLDVQLGELKPAQKIFQEKTAGVQTNAQLEVCLEYVREEYFRGMTTHEV